MKKGSIAIIGSLIGGIIGIVSVGKYSKKKIQEKNEQAQRLSAYYNMLEHWISVKQNGRNLAEYFEENCYNQIAVYGLGKIGERLVDELKDTEIQIAYGIDKNVGNVISDITVYSLEDDIELLEKVDAIIVTPIYDYDDIKKELSSKFDCRILSLEDVVREI